MHVANPPVPSVDLVERKCSGFPLTLKFNPRSYMGRFLYHRGMYEEGNVKLFAKLVKPGMTLVDVGANVGLYTVVGAHLVGPQGRVIAFEPQEDLLSILQQNIVRNLLTNVRTMPLALGAQEQAGQLFQVSSLNDGQATLQLGPGENHVGTPAAVRVRTLDGVLAELGAAKVDVMKIDVEGAELQVLRGSTQLLASSPPRFIFFEGIDDYLQRFGDTLAELLDLLNAHRYRLYWLHRGLWRKVKSTGITSGEFLARLD